LSVGVRKEPRKGLPLGKASIKWALAADSINGEKARIDLREATGVNSAGNDGRAGRECAGWACAVAAGVDLAAARDLCAWLKIPACARRWV